MTGLDLVRRTQKQTGRADPFTGSIVRLQGQRRQHRHCRHRLRLYAPRLGRLLRPGLQSRERRARCVYFSTGALMIPQATTLSATVNPFAYSCKYLLTTGQAFRRPASLYLMATPSRTATMAHTVGFILISRSQADVEQARTSPVSPRARTTSTWASAELHQRCVRLQ